MRLEDLQLNLRFRPGLDELSLAAGYEHVFTEVEEVPRTLRHLLTAANAQGLRAHA